MHIEVELFARLHKYLPEKSSKNPCRIQIGEGEKVKDVLDKLNVPSQKHAGLTILVNWTHSNLDYVPSESNKLSIFPVVTGG